MQRKNLTVSIIILISFLPLLLKGQAPEIKSKVKSPLKQRITAHAGRCIPRYDFGDTDNSNSRSMYALAGTTLGLSYAFSLVENIGMTFKVSNSSYSFDENAFGRNISAGSGTTFIAEADNYNILDLTIGVQRSG